MQPSLAGEYTQEDSELFDKAYKYNQEGKHKEALDIYTFLANKGHADAENNLGYMYKSGIGVVKDYEKAVKLYLKSATQDYVHAQVNVAFMYSNGYGIEKDNSKALYWLKRASENDFALAQFNLAIHYLDGIGVEENKQTALSYLNKACINGHTESCFAYGDLNESNEANKAVKRDK